MTRLFARHTGRHCRHGSLTGWAALASIRTGRAEGFTIPRQRPAPLTPFPLALSLIPFDNTQETR